MFTRLKRIHHVRLYSVVIIALLIFAAVFLYFHYRSSSSTTKIVTAGKPITYSQVKASQPGEKSLTNNTPSSRNSGGATDTSGSVSANTDSSKWVTSASNVITVKQPIADSTINDGGVISGSASVDEVNYRLSDNAVGVVAQGTLNVVNGNFSGALHFTPQGTGGRLDVFTTNSMGVEYNEVQINVSF